MFRTRDSAVLCATSHCVITKQLFISNRLCLVLRCTERLILPFGCSRAPAEHFKLKQGCLESLKHKDFFSDSWCIMHKTKLLLTLDSFASDPWCIMHKRKVASDSRCIMHKRKVASDSWCIMHKIKVASDSWCIMHNKKLLRLLMHYAQKKLLLTLDALWTKEKLLLTLDALCTVKGCFWLLMHYAQLPL